MHRSYCLSSKTHEGNWATQGRRSGAVRHGASQRRAMVVAALPAANPYAEELRKTAGQPLLCCLKRVRCT